MLGEPRVSNCPGPSVGAGVSASAPCGGRAGVLSREDPPGAPSFQERKALATLDHELESAGWEIMILLVFINLSSLYV